jgi:hypothetical protein
LVKLHVTCVIWTNSSHNLEQLLIQNFSPPNSPSSPTPASLGFGLGFGVRGCWGAVVPAGLRGRAGPAEVAVGGVARPGGGGAAARAVGPGSGEGAQRSRGDDRRRRWQWWEGAGPARPGKGPAELRAGGGPAPPMLMMFFPPAHLMTIKLKIFQHFSFNNSSNFWSTFYKMLEHFSETFLINIFLRFFQHFSKMFQHF